ncbi:SgcJ/EcaC family oxidoreductase [Actinoplanes sp. NPDC049802]|uniref:YybH family protein n=1 Tax=Actinoplanes sp. NPDC049802 TaxID=3154742 RepID=UPI0033E361E7
MAEQNGTGKGTLARTRAEQEFEEVYRRYDEAFRARDVETFLGFYREDVTKIDAGGDVQWSRAEVAELFRVLFEMEFTSAFEPLKTVVTDNTAVVVLDCTLTFADFTERFFTALTFTKADGEWKVLAAASTNVPG